MMKFIEPFELKDKLITGSVVLIDVREPVEHKAEYIEGACLIPLAEISQEKLPNKSQTIVVHCRSGKRSARAAEKLLAQNPMLDIYNLVGGIQAWKAAGFAVKKSTSQFHLPLERQTQLIAGAIAFLGTLFGAYVNPAFYLLPGLIGLGLIFAGMTGWCGLAKLLAKMPWNKV